jgi:chemotaxis protein methyltransferase CheR
MTLPKIKHHQTANIEVGLLLSALKERYGYDFTGYARASLKRRLMALTEYFDVDHLADLIPTLLYDEAVAQTVINSISVQTSEFFRDAPVWSAVRDVVLPQLASFPRINIWQAGCGSGEETYTLAILLHEAGLTKRMRVFTSDINPGLLQDARKGCWPVRHFEHWAENYRKAGGREEFAGYFTANGDNVFIREELKHSIEFLQHNLVTDDVFKEVQWVVCRNVLIYFGEALQTRVLQVLSRSLERGGYLLLGRSETILDPNENFSELEAVDHQHRLYRKVIDGLRSKPHV